MGAFEITEANRERGIITLSNTIDFEQHRAVNVTVMATDGGVPSLNPTAVVLCTIIDVNDNAPQWVTDFSSPYEFREDEFPGYYQFILLFSNFCTQ